ncbi:MAG: hypothetical protein SF029_14435 [bacterium]|nr:hypothetical protein [bacterium]
MTDIPEVSVRPRRDDQKVFIQLIQGLHAYIKSLESDVPAVPHLMRHALNALAFAAPRTLPKTLHSFIQLAHHPLMEWYPLLVPDTFNPSQPLMYEGRLSEEVQEYEQALVEHLQAASIETISQTDLENLAIRELRLRLKSQPDQRAAQQLYEQVRGFLIKNSWTTQEHLRRLSNAIFQEVRAFYEEIPYIPGDVLRVCSRCGLLIWRDGKWHGIKPHYCSDHADDSPYAQTILNRRQLYRLSRGAHLRVFIPGRIELALFEFAEAMQEGYAEQLTGVEFYPGIDTYDLRLTFRDKEVWAVDAKDQAYPGRLASQIQLPYGEGSLAYNYAFFVIPDARLEEDGYWETLECAVGSRPNNLIVLSLSNFQQRLEGKLKMLAKPKRTRKTSKE